MHDFWVLITINTLRFNVDIALSFISDELLAMPAERVCVGAFTRSALPNLTAEQLSNANRVFLTKRKDRKSSSAAGSPSKAVKPESPPSPASIRGSQDTPAVDEAENTQFTQAGSPIPGCRQPNPLFPSVEENLPPTSKSSTGPSSQGVTAQLATVSLASNTDSNCEFTLPQSLQDLYSFA